jgi:hypothetical protein
MANERCALSGAPLPFSNCQAFSLNDVGVCGTVCSASGLARRDYCSTRLSEIEKEKLRTALLMQVAPHALSDDPFLTYTINAGDRLYFAMFGKLDCEDSVASEEYRR